jgi:hypothetical protein
MTTFTFKINREKMKLIADKAMGKAPAIKQAAEKVFFAAFLKAKKGMLQAFDRHPVTQELLNGPTAENISDTLGGGYGNLFAFIGFDVGDTPTAPLKELLDVGTSYRISVYKNRTWYFKVKFPSRGSIEKATPMPWEVGNSWAEGIEKGISGLSNFMYKHWEGGRSQEGFQLKYLNLSNIGFKPQPYLSEILNSFRKSMNDNKGIA